MKRLSSQYVVLGLSFIAVGLTASLALSLPGKLVTIGSYSTSLRERTPSQVYNARLAAHRINGTVIQPGGVFSFNKIVGSWSKDTGFEKAPVSYDGELVESWGGGVCQTSTTLYSAALYAGMDIVERHRHHWPARYAPPGMDAAVAYSSVDLRFRNALRYPVKIVAEVQGERLACRIQCSHRPSYMVKVKREVRSVTQPGEVVQITTDGPGYRLVNPGQPGLQVVVYRYINGVDTQRQIISDDSYPAMSRIVRTKLPM